MKYIVLIILGIVGIERPSCFIPTVDGEAITTNVEGE